MVRVSGQPAPGQYAVDDCGRYSFSRADVGRVVWLIYMEAAERSDSGG